jgi:hypothetical protein
MYEMAKHATGMGTTIWRLVNLLLLVISATMVNQTHIILVIALFCIPKKIYF